MKYLKKIFESSKVDDMIVYIDDCFVDFLSPLVRDMYADTEFDYDQETYNISVKIKSHRENNRKEAGWDSRNIIKFLDTVDTLKESSILVEECIDKVKVKYPNIDYTVNLETDNSIHNLFINISFFLD